MSELLFQSTTSGTLHMESPARQPWAEILRVIASALGLSTSQSLPYAEWLQKVQANPDAAANPCMKIVPFLEDEFIRMATGAVILDTAKACKVSPTLKASAPLSEAHLMAYVEYWKREKFL